MMQPTDLIVGTTTWQLTIPDDKWLKLQRTDATPPLAPAAELLRTALDSPVGLNAPMFRAITPEDRVCIIVDEQLPQVGLLITQLFRHLLQAGIEPAQVTLLVAPPSVNQPWADDLPDEYGDVTIEVHQPGDPKKLAYLATTKSGRRIYLNRTLVEADFVAVLAGRRFDPVLGYRGAELGMYPLFSDTETLTACFAPPHVKGEQEPIDWPHEAEEIAWLSGLPMFVQPIEGFGDEIAEIVAGLPESSEVGLQRQDARWRVQVESKADLVIAAISGSPERIKFDDVATALATAARVCVKEGRVVLLTEVSPDLTEAAELLRRTEEPSEALRRVSHSQLQGRTSAELWAKSARRAHLFIASHYPDELIEELFATVLVSAKELQRLIDTAKQVIVIPDAHKTIVEIPSARSA